ncbi:MAG: hypothetical protein AAGD00_05845 [Planctomycetota bacterium]
MPVKWNRVALMLVATLVLIAWPVRAQRTTPSKSNDRLAELNELSRAADGTLDAAPVLFGALSAMDDPPPTIGDAESALLMIPSNPNWGAVERWLDRSAQRDVISAINTVTDPESEDPHTFGLIYDADYAQEAWIDAGLYPEGPFARPLMLTVYAPYVEGTLQTFAERLAIIALAESARLAADGDGEASLDILWRWFMIGRMLADRPLDGEYFVGIDMMTGALERMRDLVYVYRESFTADQIAELNNDKLGPRNTLLDRIDPPAGDRIVAYDLVEHTMRERGGPDPSLFPSTLARLAASDRPLTLFGEASRWRTVAETHAGWFETFDQITKVYGDAEKRWGIEDLFDPLLRSPSDLAETDPAQFALVFEVAGTTQAMYDRRTQLFNELGATRAALGVVAYEKVTDTLPPNVNAVQPTYVARLDRDPYSLQQRYQQGRFRQRLYRRFEKSDWYRYWVPIRDQQFDDREIPQPYQVTILTEEVDLEELAAGDGGFTLDRETAAGILAPAVANARQTAAQEAGIDLGGEPMSQADLDRLTSMLDFFDFEEFEITNYDGLREAVLELAADDLASQESIDGLTDMLREMIEDGATPDTAREVLLATLREDATAMGQDATGFTEMIGLEVSDVESAIGGLIDAVFDPPAVRAAFDTVQGGGSLSAGQTEAAITAMIEGVVQPEAMDPVLRVVRSALESPAVQPFLAMMSMSGSQFTRSFDDSTFLLYSVGPDVQDGRAAVVGVGAPDILFWPPVISLRREHELGG